MEELKMESKKIIMQQFFENVGGSRLLDWLEEVGYYTAPASMKHHASYEGSLFDHSLQVTHELIMLTDKLGLKWQRKESRLHISIIRGSIPLAFIFSISNTLHPLDLGCYHICCMGI